MPDRATIEAATPKCPRDGCGRLLSFRMEFSHWRCPRHGAVLTPEHLTSTWKVAA